MKSLHLFPDDGDTSKKAPSVDLKEFSIMVKLDHPNIMPLLGISFVNDKFAIVLPLMENKDLRLYIMKQKHVNISAQV